MPHRHKSHAPAAVSGDRAPIQPAELLSKLVAHVADGKADSSADLVLADYLVTTYAEAALPYLEGLTGLPSPDSEAMQCLCAAVKARNRVRVQMAAAANREHTSRKLQ